ncbi:helicase associated domain-containing protein [Candidatus Babeliales bacterium]|nr:helicase associated domain-containing protein [Candidatus Babeliales bacterium]
MSEDKLTYLKQLNTFVDRILDKWTPWLELCKDYEKNDLIVYSTIYKDKPIGTWLSQQLTSYKQKKMSDDRFQRLKQINAWNDKFINKLQIKWNKKYNLCAEFEKTNTLIKGTVNYKNEPIGSWFQEQRKSHNKGKLKEDRLKKLKQLKTWAHRSRKK